jgi:plasmid stabilization system protein ParE
VQVVWTDPALEDIEAIRDYFLNQVRNPQAADRVTQAIVKAGDALDVLPLRGQRQADGSHEFPVVAYPQYRLVYDVVTSADVIEILHVETTRTAVPLPAAHK